jgi:hypothetical protein
VRPDVAAPFSDLPEFSDLVLDCLGVGAVSALAGSVVGGLTSGITTLMSQRAQARAGQFAHDMSRREDLYKDFIVAASRAYGNAS